MKKKIVKTTGALLSAALLMCGTGVTAYADTAGADGVIGSAAVKYAYGDVDANGKLEVSDALAILRDVVQLEKIKGDLATELADTDHNGKIATADALTVLRCVVNLQEPEYYLWESAPTTAAELVARYNESEHANYSMQINTHLTTGRVGEETSLYTSFSKSGIAERNGNSVYGHSISYISMSDDDDNDYEYETKKNYYEILDDGSITQYAKTDDATTWTKSVYDEDGLTAFDITDSVTKIEWTGFEETEDGYWLTTDFKRFATALKDALTNEGVIQDAAGITIDGFSDGKVTYVFDKDYNLTAISMDDVNQSVTSEEDGEMIHIYVGYAMEMTFDQFGMIHEIAVPQEVSNAAE